MCKKKAGLPEASGYLGGFSESAPHMRRAIKDEIFAGNPGQRTGLTQDSDFEGFSIGFCPSAKSATVIFPPVF